LPSFLGPLFIVNATREIGIINVRDGVQALLN